MNEQTTVPAAPTPAALIRAMRNPDPFARAGDPVNWQGYLILTQTDGLDHMRLRVFGLPVESVIAV